jgi:hypothetical protein
MEYGENMILFVGDKPSKRTDPNIPFKNALCEKRLKAWIASLGCKEGEYKIVNSVSEYIDTIVVLANHSNVPVVALGANASEALKAKHINHYKLPHPSGLNRQINDQKFIVHKLQECKRWLTERHVS